MPWQVDRQVGFIVFARKVKSDDQSAQHVPLEAERGKNEGRAEGQFRVLLDR